jgi:hypothetical protein
MLSPQLQMIVGFILFLLANAAAQGLIPDTTIGKWVVLTSTCASLWMQRMGIVTEPPPARRASPQDPPKS